MPLAQDTAQRVKKKRKTLAYASTQATGSRTNNRDTGSPKKKTGRVLDHHKLSLGEPCWISCQPGPLSSLILFTATSSRFSTLFTVRPLLILPLRSSPSFSITAASRSTLACLFIIICNLLSFPCLLSFRVSAFTSLRAPRGQQQPFG